MAMRKGKMGPSRKNWTAKTDFAHAQELAQKKTEECMGLKRKLEEVTKRQGLKYSKKKIQHLNHTILSSRPILIVQ